MDLAFLTEMSNLSPPIIHPPPSYFRTAPPHLAGQFSFGGVGPLSVGTAARLARRAARYSDGRTQQSGPIWPADSRRVSSRLGQRSTKVG